MSELTNTRQFLGLVDVDSGTIVISDPAYCLPNRDRDKPGLDYEAVIQADTTVTSTYLGNGLVLLISNFGGDGTFPVYGEFEDGELIRVTVEFVEPDSDEDEASQAESTQ